MNCNAIETNFESDLNAALPVLKEIDDLYNAANSIRQRMDMRHTNKKADYKKTARLKAGIISIGSYAVLRFLCSSIVKHVHTSFGAAILMLILAIGSIASFCAYFRLKKYFLNLEPTETNEDISAAKKLDNISERIYVLSLENNDLLEKIPADYRCYDAVQFMDRAMLNGRAENKKEAMNLYEEELHRRRLETNGAIAIHIQQEQSRMLSDIEYNSHRAAVNSGIAAVGSSISATFSVLSYLDRI